MRGQHDLVNIFFKRWKISQVFPKADATHQPGRETGKIIRERLSRPDANSFSVKDLQITPDPKLQNDSPLDLAWVSQPEDK